MALDPEGRPVVSYVREGVGGFIEFAAAADDWEPVTVSRGNYAGPADVAFDSNGRPHLAWHDHEQAEVSPRSGNLVHAVRDGGAWRVETVRDQGHDGFQSSIALDGATVHAAGIEPVQYQTDQGVEHYELTPDGWRAVSIGTGPLEYEYDVSLAIRPGGLPALTYHDDRNEALVFASSDGDAWTLERVAAGDEAGEFSALAFDDRGRPHIAFVQGGVVRHAVREAGGWRIEEVGPGRGGVALVLDGAGAPHVAFVDAKAVRYAVRDADGWRVEDVATAGRRPLGGRISLELDGDGVPHLAFFELAAPKRGVVLYARG